MSSGCGLLDLPNELLLPILNELPDNQLLSIAFLSRRLHLLALPIHLYRLKILDDSANYSSCNITLSRSSFSALPALRKSLFIESIKHLTCEFPCTSTGAVDDVQAVTSFVSRLTSVNEASLLFRGIYIRQPSVPLEKWTSAFSEMLRTLADKSCTTIRLRHADAPAGAFGGGGGGGLFKGERKKFNILSRPFDAIRTMHKTRDQEKPAYYSLPHALFPLAALNSSTITHLSVEYMNVTPKVWSELLPTITLPALSSLRVTWCQINISELISFLVRHPSITTLDVHRIERFPLKNKLSVPFYSSPSSSSQPAKSLLPNLTTVDADIAIVCFLMRATIPSIQSVNIFDEVNYPGSGPEFEAFDIAFAGYTRESTFALHLTVSLVFGTQETQPTPDEDSNAVVSKDDPNRQWRHLVRSVALNTNVLDDHLKTKGKQEVVPKWLSRRFWDLRLVSVGHDCGTLDCVYHRVEKDDRITVKKSIMDACPTVTTVLVNGVRI